MLSRRALNRALLARQLLLKLSPMGPLEAIEHLVGLSGQTSNSPYLGLWTRLERFRITDLSDLITARQVVRGPLMRSAVQLVSARDYHGLRGLTRPSRAADPDLLGGVDLAELRRFGRELAEERPRTVADLAALLGERWPDADQRALAAVVRAEIALVQVPPHSLWGAVGQPTYTSAEQWLGPRSAGAMTAGELVLRYLAAFGPATVSDMQAWSGLTGLQEVTDRLGDRLVLWRGEDGVELLDLPDAPLPDPDVPAPPCFLPEFDGILHSHADRSRIMADETAREILRTPGIVPGTVLVDGFVRGTWKITHHKGAATLVVRPLAQIPTRDVHELTEEGLRLLDVAAADATRHDVKFNSAERS